jgi:alpha-1,2-mannosyltransferase
VNLLVILACFADLTMDLRLPGTRRTLPRGVLVGLTAAVKLTPLVFLPLLLLTSQRRAAMRAFVTFVAAGAGSALVAPGVSRDFWLRAVLDTKRAGSAAWLGNQGVRGVWFRMAHHPVGSGATLVVGIAICSLGVGLGALAYGRIAPIFGVAVCWAAESLGSPISWSHHMVWVVPLILWLAFGRHEVISGARWATALSVLFVAAPIWWAPHSQQQEYAEHGLTLLFTSSFALASFGVLVATAALLVRTSRAAPAVPAVAAAGARPFPGAKAAS